MGRSEPLELAHQLRPGAERELRVGPSLDREQAPLLQLPCVPRERELRGDAGERAATPYPERLDQPVPRGRRIAGGGRRPPLLEQRLEPLEVELARLDP